MEADWTYKEYSLNDYLGEEISLRFYFSSDLSVEDEGIFIDEFTLYLSSPELNVPTDIEPVTAASYSRTTPTRSIPSVNGILKCTSFGTEKCTTLLLD